MEFLLSERRRQTKLDFFGRCLPKLELGNEEKNVDMVKNDRALFFKGMTVGDGRRRKLELGKK